MVFPVVGYNSRRTISCGWHGTFSENQAARCRRMCHRKNPAPRTALVDLAHRPLYICSKWLPSASVGRVFLLRWGLDGHLGRPGDDAGVPATITTGPARLHFPGTRPWPAVSRARALVQG